MNHSIEDNRYVLNNIDNNPVLRKYLNFLRIEKKIKEINENINNLNNLSQFQYPDGGSYLLHELYNELKDFYIVNFITEVTTNSLTKKVIEITPNHETQEKFFNEIEELHRKVIQQELSYWKHPFKYGL